MKRTIKSSLIIVLAVLLVSTTTAMARTVRYHGVNVEWNYVRIGGLWGYSQVKTSHFIHSTTVNGKFSGWEPKGKLAYVRTYIGHKSLEAYWNCK